MTTPTQPNIERLRTIRQFMAELPEEKFDFSEFTNDCGTVCCAAGWLPSMFPGEWELSVNSAGYLYPRLYNSSGSYFYRFSATVFFGLPLEVIEALFFGDNLIVNDGELENIDTSDIEIDENFEYPPSTILQDVEDMSKVTTQDWLDRFDTIMDYLGIKEAVL